MTRIKFCGLTREEDVAVAADLGVDAMGFVLWDGSPRGLDIVSAARLIDRLPPTVTPVGVFVRPSRDQIARAVEIAGIRVAQIHGTGEIAPLTNGRWDVWVAASLGTEPVGDWTLRPAVAESVMVLLDTHDPEYHGGTGRSIDWDAAGRISTARRVFLAGGLTPANVGEAIARARPYGVDVSSGIEERPGVKSAVAMREFVTAVRSVDVERCNT